MTFLFGLLALLAWLYATGGDTWSLRLMWIGLLYGLFASLLNAIPEFVILLASGDLSDWWFGILAILFAPIIEELVKSHAARSQKMAVRSFALVCLFGIYELLLSKPMVSYETFGWPAFVEALDTLPALTMHFLTAAIYSFAFTARRVIQITTCVIIHAGFNGLWVADLLYLLPIVSTAAILVVVWLFPWNDKRTQSQSLQR